MRKQYRRDDLGVGVRGKHAAAYQQGTNRVLLQPDVAAAFPTSAAVNDALKGLLRTEKTMARKKTNPHVGSNFEDFLAEEGRLQESTALAIKVPNVDTRAAMDEARAAAQARFAKVPRTAKIARTSRKAE